MWTRSLSCLVLLLATVARAETLEESVRGYVANADAEKRWTIKGALGLTVTDGNSDTVTFNAGANAVRTFDPWKLTLKFSMIYAESEGDETANEEILLERLERQLTERSWLFQDLLLEHDEQEALNYRLQLTLGYKRLLVKKGDTFELYGEVGGGVLHEEFRVDPETEAIAQLGIFVKWQITKDLLFEQTLTLYPSLSDTGEFRAFSESAFTTPIGERFDLRLAIIDQYDSNAPAGIEKNDLKIMLAIVIRFTDE